MQLLQTRRPGVSDSLNNIQLAADEQPDANSLESMERDAMPEGGSAENVANPMVENRPVLQAPKITNNKVPVVENKKPALSPVKPVSKSAVRSKSLQQKLKIVAEKKKAEPKQVPKAVMPKTHDY